MVPPLLLRRGATRALRGRHTASDLERNALALGLSVLLYLNIPH